MVQFKRKNVVTAINVSIWKVLFEYICWTLAGKPDNYKVKQEKK